MVPSNRSPTNWGLATDQWKLLFELVGDRSVTVPKPFSNQLLQLQRSHCEVIDKSLTTFKLKPNENSSANLMHFYRWELGESLQRMCDWGFNELLTHFYAVQCRAMNTALGFYDLFGQDFANLYAFQYQAHEKKMSPVLISTRELTFTIPGFGDLTSYGHLSVFIYNRRWPVQARVVATEFLLFIYLRATYMLAFLCRIPFNPYFTEL